MKWQRRILAFSALLLLTCARGAGAAYQFNVLVDDLEEIDCWNSASCSATAGSVTIVSDEDPGVTHEFACSIFQGGVPLAYSFVVDADDWTHCEDGASYTITERQALFEGPGFQYELVNSIGVPYPCDMPFPVRLIPAPGSDGCVEWAWPEDCELDCEIVLLEDFEVPAGETLTIPPGSTITCLPGVTFTVRGELLAPGSAEHPITITGQNWDGLEFLGDGTGLLSHCRIHAVTHEGAGGALRLTDQAQVRLTRCLVSGNESSGDGGAAWLAGESVLSLQACTIAHNRGAATGGVQLEGGQCLLEANLSLVTHAEPAGSEIRGAGFVHLESTDVFPQLEDFPAGLQPPRWHCDPGYLNPSAGDFHISFWAPEDGSLVNCTIDVSISELELDPDGTPGDMGAFPFDQHLVLRPATILAVTDRAEDQGGTVLVEFLASPNDGSWINPTTLYSVWIRYPGMNEDDWVAAGAVAAQGDPGRHYVVPVATLDDRFEGHENVHEFLIGTHSVQFSGPALSAVVPGFSLDNRAPEPVTDVWDTDWEVDPWPPFWVNCDVDWSYETPQDFSHFVVLGSQVEDPDTAQLVYQGTDAHCTLTLEGGPPSIYFLWIWAVDRHGNAGPAMIYIILSMDLEPGRPAAFVLEPNLPNPFNPSTRIAYELPTAGQLRLTVFNLVGAEVARLVDGHQPAGRHELLFDGSGLASGVYVYRLETPGQCAQRKMLLLK
ncbi:MAG: hypothetical protein WC326_08940 [Candidatus Delongbacteria bacterium]